MQSKLSHTERKVLSFLALGHNYQYITQKLGKSPANINTVCDHIRKNTGILCTRDAEECANFLRGIKHTQKRALVVTPAQLEVLELLARGMTFEKMAKETGLSIHTLRNHATTGCARAGLSYKGRGEQRVAAIKAYLESREAATDALATVAAPCSPNVEDY